MVNEVNTRGKMADGMTGQADPRLYLRDEELNRGVGLILAGERALMAAVADAILASDLSSGEWQILLAILFEPGRDVSTVREGLGATVPTFARQLGRLDKRGLIDKSRSGSDGRKRALYLSGDGEALVAPVAGTLRETLRLAFRDAGSEAVNGAKLVLDALASQRPLP